MMFISLDLRRECVNVIKLLKLLHQARYNVEMWKAQLMWWCLGERYDADCIDGLTLKRGHCLVHFGFRRKIEM